MTERALRLGHNPAIPMDLPVAPAPPEVSAREVRAEMEQIISRNLPRVTAVLAFLFAGFAVAQFLMKSPASAVLGKFSVGIAGVCMLGWLLTAKFELPGRWAHPFCSFFAGLILVAELLQLYVTRDPWQTAHLILLVLASSSLFLAIDWFLLLTGAVMISWSALAVMLFPKMWMTYGLALGLAGSIGFIIQVVRVRTIENLETLKLQNNAHRKLLVDAINKARSAQKRFHLLSEATAEAVFLHVGGRILDANKAAARLFGYVEGELSGKMVTELISPDYHHVVKCNTSAMQSAPINIYALRANRSLFPVLLTNSMVLMDGVEVTVTSVRDNSTLKKVEETAAIEQRRLKKKLKRHEVLATVSLVCNQAQNFTEATEQLLMITNREFPVSIGSVFLGKGLQNGYNVIASTFSELKAGTPLKPGASPQNLLNLMAGNPEPLFLADLKDAAFEIQTLFPFIQPKALAAIPLVNNGKFVALMVCFESSPRKYDKEDCDFLSCIASTLLSFKY